MRAQALTVAGAECLGATLVAAELLLGCASPGLRSQQMVTVETPGCPEVTCELSNDQGHWLLARTPGTVAVTSSHAALRVSCRNSEGALGLFSAGSSMGSTSGGGAVVGGAVGAGAVFAAVGTTALAFIPVAGAVAVIGGAAIGALGGQAAESSARPIRYPDRIVVPMSCTRPSGDTQHGPIFGLGIRGLSTGEARIIGLGERTAVLVTFVAEGSLSAAAGLRANDIVLRAGDAEIDGAAALERVASAVVAGSAIPLTIRRGEQTISLLMVRPAVAP